MECSKRIEQHKVYYPFQTFFDAIEWDIYPIFDEYTP